MSQSPLAEQLYQLLPAVYRERDQASSAQAAREGDERQPGDLEALLQAYGSLLDQWKNTLDQRYYDNFPDRDPRRDALGRERNCQAWLLPYFAQLVDVNLVSPDTAGQREEVTHAVAWRQRKGTRVATEQIAEAVGQMEVEVQEGWQRLARTPRINDPLLPESHFGLEGAIPPDATPADRARHPGLPSITPDMRYASRPLRVQGVSAPAAHRTRFDGETQLWIQANPGGAPCFPGSYQDASQRTPDLRTPSSTRGHFHPRRALLYAAPPAGLCDPSTKSISWSKLVDQLQDPDHSVHKLFECRQTSVQWQGESWQCVHLRGLTPQPLKLAGTMRLGESDDPFLSLKPEQDPDKIIYRLDNLWLDNRVTLVKGRAELHHCAARQFHVLLAERDWPVIEAHSCLFKDIKAPRGLISLEYCTVMRQLLAEHLWMSDSITLPIPSKDRVNDYVPGAGCIRYSRVPTIPDERWEADSQLRLSKSNSTTDAPIFLNDSFGKAGAGVLHWDCPKSITEGAEDRGEMGAYHDARHQLRWQAVLDKLANYLPLGIEAALIPDTSLQRPPPWRR